MALTVVRGYKSAKGSSRGEVCILTLDGEKIFVREEDIEEAFENEAPKKDQSALTTFFIKPNSTVRVEVNLQEQSSGGAGPAKPKYLDDGETIYKYLDDGGTISKSRDDTMQPATIAKYIDDGGTVRKSLDDYLIDPT